MVIDERRDEFIQAWGALGSRWGVNRTMAKVHALLLIAPEPLCAEEVMELLSISRGNANMSLRGLMDWGLVSKVVKSGERKEYFVADNDVWKLARQVVRERRKRELEPILEALAKVETPPETLPDGVTPEEEARFNETVENLQEFAADVDRLFQKVIAAEENWLLRKLLRNL